MYEFGIAEGLRYMVVFLVTGKLFINVITDIIYIHTYI